MQVSLSQNVNSYNNFKAQQPQKSTNVLDNVLNEKDKLEIQSKKVKSAVKRCIGVIILIDVIYFTMKRSFKHANIAKAIKKPKSSTQLKKPKIWVSERPQGVATFNKMLIDTNDVKKICASA